MTNKFWLHQHISKFFVGKHDVKHSNDVDIDVKQCKKVHQSLNRRQFKMIHGHRPIDVTIAMLSFFIGFLCKTASTDA